MGPGGRDEAPPLPFVVRRFGPVTRWHGLWTVGRGSLCYSSRLSLFPDTNSVLCYNGGGVTGKVGVAARAAGAYAQTGPLQALRRHG